MERIFIEAEKIQNQQFDSQVINEMAMTEVLDDITPIFNKFKGKGKSSREVAEAIIGAAEYLMETQGDDDE